MKIVLIAGMWLDGRSWQQVIPELERHGHDAVAVSLPGQGGAPAEATLDDQVAAVVAAVDQAGGPVVVVGHSAAATLAWVAADARPEVVARVVMVGGFPVADGSAYFDAIEPVDGQVVWPGWQTFAGPDSDDLDEAARALMELHLHPVSSAITHARVRLGDERRYQVPVTLICPEFSVEDARTWIASGELTELEKTDRLDFADIDSGHWPMYSAPVEFAAMLDEITRR